MPKIMNKKTLSINNNKVVVHKQVVKKTFYELYYLPNVKKLQELHKTLNRVPTIADIRNLLNCEVSQAEKLYNLYISDDKKNKDCQVELPNFLLKSLTHAVNMIVAERNTDIEQSNKDIAEANKELTEQNQVLLQQNKNLQNDLLTLQGKLNEANAKIKELNNDKLVAFLKEQLQLLQAKYDEAMHTLFKVPKQKSTKVKTDLPITSLADLFTK